MAIDRTPWNALVDDDGSNLVGTIWNKDKIKTVILDPVDAAFATPLYGTWTPTDASGAAMTFQTGTKGSFSKLGRLVFLWFQIVFPSTATGQLATIGGIPYICRSPVGGSQGYGVHRMWWLVEGGQVIHPLNPVDAGYLPNSVLSGANIIVSLVYLTD